MWPFNRGKKKLAELNNKQTRKLNTLLWSCVPDYENEYYLIKVQYIERDFGRVVERVMCTCLPFFSWNNGNKEIVLSELVNRLALSARGYADFDSDRHALASMRRMGMPIIVRYEPKCYT